MKIRTATLSSIFAAALLAACGGGGSVSTPSTVPSQKAALDAATEFLANLDVLRSSTPASGAVAFALADGCNLTDGRSKA